MSQNNVPKFSHRDHNWLIKLQRLHDRGPRANAISWLGGSGAGRVIRQLITARPPVGVRALAAAAAVSPGTVAKLLPTLVESGTLERDSAGQVILIRPRDLIARWTCDYGFQRSHSEIRWYLAPRGIRNTLKKISWETPATYTGAIAARCLLPEDSIPMVPPSLAALYAQDIDALAAELQLVPTAVGTANFVIASPRDPILLTASRSAGPTDGFGPSPSPSVPLGQALADLLTLPGRGPEQADQLMDLLGQADPVWRR